MHLSAATALHAGTDRATTARAHRAVSRPWARVLRHQRLAPPAYGRRS